MSNSKSSSPAASITVPSAPVTIPYNTRFFWPLNLDLGGVKLISASAQPICQRR